MPLPTALATAFASVGTIAPQATTYMIVGGKAYAPVYVATTYSVAAKVAMTAAALGVGAVATAVAVGAGLTTMELLNSGAIERIPELFL